jgi:hypothetical protein
MKLHNRVNTIGMQIISGSYAIGYIATFVKLTWYDGYIYNAWNWLIAIPVNFAMAGVWPLYWLMIKPLHSVIFG